jgi:DHA1 family tetracycline resistance protein-like MFS transporter
MFGPKKKSISAIFAVFFFQWFSVGLSYPLFSFFLFDKDLTFLPTAATDTLRGLWLGIVFGVLSLMQFISAPIFGTLSDQKGRRSMLQVMYGFNFFGCLLALISVVGENLHILILSRIFIGIGAGCTGIVYAVMTDVSEKSSLSKNFGLLNAIRAMGYAVGSYLSALTLKISLPGFDQLANPVVFAAIGAALCSLILFFFFEETYHIRQKAANIWGDFKKGFKIPHVKVALFTVFIFCFGWSFYFEFMPVTWIKGLHANKAQVGNLYALSIAFNALCGAVLIRPFFNHFRNLTILKYSMPLLGLSIGVLMLELNSTFLWIIVPIQQLLVALVYVSLVTEVSNLATKETKGQLLGTYQSVKSLSFAISPFSGALLGITYLMPVILSSTFILIAALMIYRRKSAKV